MGKLKKKKKNKSSSPYKLCRLPIPTASQLLQQKKDLQKRKRNFVGEKVEKAGV